MSNGKTIDADPKKVQETFGKLRGRTTAVATNAVERLVHGGELDVGSFDVLVDVRVVCTDCGTQYRVEELIDNDGCDCYPALITKICV